MPTRVDKNIWTPELKRVYQKYPASIRSSDWAEIVRLANSGKVDDAMELAKSHQGEHKSHRAQNVIARRLRIQRVALFAMQKQNTDKIKAVFKVAAAALVNVAARTAPTPANLAIFKKRNHEVVVDLRRALTTIITDSIWNAIVMGVKNMGEAIKPILRDNQESFQEELKEVALIEENLTFGVTTGFASRSKGHVEMGSDKWTAKLDRLYTRIAKLSSDDGMTLSDRIWDITNRMELDMRRTLAAEIGSGSSAREIAKKLEDYVTAGDADVEGGPGVYKSPLKNALRVARTETSRAYSNATAVWAQDKSWVKGLQVTLSPAHDQEDECDDLAGNVYPADEFPDIIPAHPHCMCFGTYVIDDSNLVSADDSSTEEE